MDSLSLNLSPSDHLLLQQTITELKTRLQRQNIKLTTSNEEPFQKIMQGTLIEKFLNQPFNKSWTTSICIETKGNTIRARLLKQLVPDFRPSKPSYFRGNWILIKTSSTATEFGSHHSLVCGKFHLQGGK